MKVGIIGCGFVFDRYMPTWNNHPELKILGVSDIDKARLAVVSQHYNLKAYDSNEALLADPDIELVVNLTSIPSHYEVSKAALEAGKHVYSEKPLVTKIEQAIELVDLAESRGLRLSCAPSNFLSSTSQTLWKAVNDGAVGDVRLVYGEYDAPPWYVRPAAAPQSTSADDFFPYIYPGLTRSITGAPFPYLKEMEMGCTHEHVGYHLTNMCAIFGPVKSVTAFSKQIMPDKTDHPLHPADTPDFSVAVLNFHSGLTARVTCSLTGANDVRLRILGNRGILTTATFGDYHCPVFLNMFSKLAVRAEYISVVKKSRFLRWLFGVNEKSLPLVPMPSARRVDTRLPWWNIAARIKTLQTLEDKCLGIAELVSAIRENRPQFPAHDFTIHVTELTLAIQAAGPESQTYTTTTTFSAPHIPDLTRKWSINYLSFRRLSWRSRFVLRLLDVLPQLVRDVKRSLGSIGLRPSGRG